MAVGVQHRLWSEPGGILQLLDLIEEHRGPLDYDFRSRFGLGLDDVGGKRLGWAETVRLMTVLRRDPSSQFAASIEKWDRPVSAEWAMLADLFDLQHMSKAKKRPDPIPRPWDKSKRSSTTRRGDAAGRTRAEVVAILNDHGHNLPVP